MNKNKQNSNLSRLLKKSVEELFEMYGHISVKIEPKNYSFKSSSRLINGVINFQNENICGTLEIKASKRFLNLTNPSNVVQESTTRQTDWLKEFTNLLMGNLKSNFALCNINITQDSPVSSPNIPKEDNRLLRIVTIPRICLKISFKNTSCWLTMFAVIDGDISFEEKNDRGIFIGVPGEVVLFR